MARLADLPRSDLSQIFLWHWEHVIHGPSLEREYRFAPGRRFPFDFAHLESKIAIELNGGVWVGGRHVSGAGFERDCEKRCLAAAGGWRVFELTSTMLRTNPRGWCEMILRAIEGES